MNEKKLRVLIVDDEKSLREPLARFLETDYGYQVEAVANGTEALESVQETGGQYDVALIDEVLLNGPDGVQTLQQIKALYPDIEAIMLTGWGTDAKERALHAGAFRYLEKPVDNDELALLIRTAGQQVRLRSIGRAILAERDPEKMLSSTAGAACSLALADEAAVVLLDPVTGGLRIHDKPHPDDQRWNTHFKNGQLSRDIIHTGQIRRISDTELDERVAPQVTAAGIRSFVGLPIPGDNGNLGALYVYSSRPGRFEDWGTVAVLQTLTSQAGLALVNAQAFQQVRTHASYMEALVRTGQRLTQTTQLADQLALARQFLSEHLQVPTFSIALYEPNTDYVWFPLSYVANQPAETPPRTLGEDPGRWGVMGHVIKTGQELLWHSGEEKAERCSSLGIEPIPEEEPGQWGFCLPLTTGQEITGALCVQSRDQVSFSHPFRDGCRSLSNQLAATIENARLFRQLKETRDHLSSLVANSFDAVISIDRDRRIRTLNPAAERMLGWMEDEMIGESVLRLHTSREEAQHIHDTLQKNETITDWEITLRHKDGTPIPVLLSARQIRDDRGRPTGQVGFLRDLRLRDQLRALIKASQAISQAENLEETLSLVVHSAVDAFPAAQSGGIHLYDERTGWLHIRASTVDYSDEAIQALTFQVGEGVTGWVFQHEHPLVVPDTEQEERYKRVDHPEVKDYRSMVCVPLRTKEKIIGTLSLSNAHIPNAFERESLGLVTSFAEQATIAIENVRLRRETLLARERIRAYYEASNALTSSQEPKKVLRKIVELAQVASGASWASVMLIDGTGRVQQAVTVGAERERAVTDMIRPDGLSSQVMESEEPVTIENVSQARQQINPSMFEEGVQAAACLPLSLHGERLGVMWVHYDAPRRFSKSEIDALQLYVNQAAIAYDSARRLQELEHLRQAAEKLASKATVQETLQQIVASAREVLGANSAVIWSFDAARGTFVPDELVVDGIEPELVAEYRKDAPRPGGTADVVIKRKYVAVTDVDHVDFAFLKSSSPGLRGAIGVKAFQGIVLQEGKEVLGVLYVNYNRHRGFTVEDRATLETFAHHATLSLKKARLLAQVRKAHSAAGMVARVTTLGDFEATLASVADGLQEATGCDAVTLYVYDPVTQKLHHPPTMVGVRDPDGACRLRKVAEDSIVYNMLRRDQPYIAEDTSRDEQFENRRFTQEEEVKSCVAVPLKVIDETVGVIFVNYRSSHRFTDEELANVNLLANQAAVAIKHAQLYAELERRADTLEALYEASKAVAGTLSLDETLNLIVRQAKRFTVHHGQEAHFSTLGLTEGDILRIRAAHPTRYMARLEMEMGKLNLQDEDSAGIVGQAAITGESQLVPDVDEDPRYVSFISETRSELAVPVKLGDAVIGVINVEHADLHAFNTNNQRDLESLAAQAAIAIRNVQLYEEATRRAKVLETLHEASQAVTGTLTIDEVLKRIAEQAWRLAKPTGEKNHFSHLAQVREDYCVTFVAAHPDRILTRLQKKQICLDGDDPIGITGRTARKARSQLVQDVRRDPDYIPTDPNVHSQLSVPIQMESRVIGVISVEHPNLSAFDAEDQRALEALAAHAAQAMRNAQIHAKVKEQYADLSRIKGFVGSQTALDWITMVSTQWGHSIRREVGTALTWARVVRGAIQKGDYDKALQDLQKLKSSIERIREIPIIAPLLDEDAVNSVRINGVLEGYLRRLWKHPEYKSIELKLDLEPGLDEVATVRASKEWLRRGIEIVVENAVQAMLRANSETRQLQVETYQVDGKIEVIIRDTGPGIPTSIRKKIFKEPIKKPKDSQGAGIGLLLANTIFEAYQGQIEIRETGPTGTRMAISLPVEVEDRQTPTQPQ